MHIFTFTVSLIWRQETKFMSGINNGLSRWKCQINFLMIFFPFSFNALTLALVKTFIRCSFGFVYHGYRSSLLGWRRLNRNGNNGPESTTKGKPLSGLAESFCCWLSPFFFTYYRERSQETTWSRMKCI